MKAATTEKNGWLAQSNKAQLNWPSREASRPSVIASSESSLAPFGQLPDRVAVGGREHLLHRLLPGQPHLRDVLLGIEGRHRDLRDQETEHVLGVVADVGGVAVAPLRPDLVAIL